MGLGALFYAVCTDLVNPVVICAFLFGLALGMEFAEKQKSL